MKKLNKHEEYAALICGKISELLDEEHESDYHIPIKDLENPDNAKAFFYALGHLAPQLWWNKLTQEDADPLEFNHAMNRLIFEFAKHESGK